MPAVANLDLSALNMFGPISIVAAVEMLVLASLTGGLVPLSPAASRKWTVAAPFLVCAICPLTILFSVALILLVLDKPLMSDDLDAGAAIIIYVVTGFVFALQNLRYTDMLCRVNAAVFSLLFGAAIVLFAVASQSDDLRLVLVAAAAYLCACLLVVVFFLLRPREKAQDRREDGHQPRGAPLQFSLRGLLTGVLVVAVILGLSRGLVNVQERSDLHRRKGALQQELLDLRARMQSISSEQGRVLGSTGDQIIARLDSAIGENRGPVAYLQSVGLDFAQMDASEAVVFWLAVERLSRTSGQPGGGSAGPPTQRDWQALVSDGCFYLNRSTLIDSDHDHWPELLFYVGSPRHPQKTFRLADGKIVAWDTEADPATGVRKGYALDDGGELVSFDVAESPP